MAKGPSKAATQLAAVKAHFPNFLKNNADASIVQVGKRKKYHLIDRPWNDDSVAFLLPDNPQELNKFAKAMEVLLLPPRLSAIYHSDRKELEVIFTTRKLSKDLTVLKGRKFKFHFRGKHLTCEFAKSTDRLLTIAGHAIYPQNSATDYRNLQSFTQYQIINDASINRSYSSFAEQFDEPISFFIRNIRWEDEKRDLCRCVTHSA